MASRMVLSDADNLATRDDIPWDVFDGKTVVVTTQVQNEGSDLAVYNVGHRLKSDLGVLESYDMTLEAAVAKLMWALAQSKDRDAVRVLFYSPVAGEILAAPEDVKNKTDIKIIKT